MYKVLVFILIISESLYSNSNLHDQILSAKAKVFPALVHIQPIKEIFASGEKHKVQVTGSGVIISADGYVVTNNHVAEKAQQDKLKSAKT